MSYAETTKVPVTQSKGDIEKLVKKYGADAFGIMESGGRAKIAFRISKRNILFQVTMPEEPQQERSMWRALLLTIKGKLESAERDIETFEDAFLANIVMPDGRTIGETTIPAIEQAYEGHAVPLLPHY